MQVATRTTSSVEMYLSALNDEANELLLQHAKRALQRSKAEKAAFEASRPSVLNRGGPPRPGQLKRQSSLAHLPDFLQLGLDGSGEDGNESDEVEEEEVEALAAASIDTILPSWFEARWEEAEQALRRAETHVARSTGQRRPSMQDLERDTEASSALAALARLRQMRAVLLDDETLREARDEDFDASGTFVRRADRAAPAGGYDDGQGSSGGHEASSFGHGDESFAHQRDRAHGLFSGYSRELLRLRQSLSRSLTKGESDGPTKAQFLLGALAQRARTDASVLDPAHAARRDRALGGGRRACQVHLAVRAPGSHGSTGLLHRRGGRRLVWRRQD